MKYTRNSVNHPVLTRLPRTPDEGSQVWTNGKIVLCGNPEIAERVAGILMENGVDNCITGYFDPAGDEYGIMDEAFWGWYYVAFR